MLAQLEGTSVDNHQFSIAVQAIVHSCGGGRIEREVVSAPHITGSERPHTHFHGGQQLFHQFQIALPSGINPYLDA
jgi:hypothetical protein